MMKRCESARSWPAPWRYLAREGGGGAELHPRETRRRRRGARARREGESRAREHAREVAQVAEELARGEAREDAAARLAAARVGVHQPLRAVGERAAVEELDDDEAQRPRARVRAGHHARADEADQRLVAVRRQQLREGRRRRGVGRSRAERRARVRYRGRARATAARARRRRRARLDLVLELLLPLRVLRALGGDARFTTTSCPSSLASLTVVAAPAPIVLPIASCSHAIGATSSPAARAACRSRRRATCARAGSACAASMRRRTRASPARNCRTVPGRPDGLVDVVRVRRRRRLALGVRVAHERLVRLRLLGRERHDPGHVVRAFRRTRAIRSCAPIQPRSTLIGTTESSCVKKQNGACHQRFATPIRRIDSTHFNEIITQAGKPRRFRPRGTGSFAAAPRPSSSSPDPASGRSRPAPARSAAPTAPLPRLGRYRRGATSRSPLPVLDDERAARRVRRHAARLHLAELLLAELGLDEPALRDEPAAALGPYTNLR